MKLNAYEELVISRTKEPAIEKTKWAKTSKLCMMFVEFRYMDILKYNLWNVANVYGGGDTTLVIVHSGDNKEIIMETTKDWENVRYIQAMEKNQTVKEYDTLITSYEFWDKFSEFEHVLTNTWDSYIFKKIPDKFFNYDIVGGACGHYYVPYENSHVNICRMDCPCPRCKETDHELKENNFNDHPNIFFHFNGGFYLRNVESTKKLCNSKPHTGEPDDVYFTISKLTRPTREESLEFGVQDYVSENPVGCHQIWVGHTDEYILKLFDQVK